MLLHGTLSSSVEASMRQWPERVGSERESSKREQRTCTLVPTWFGLAPGFSIGQPGIDYKGCYKDKATVTLTYQVTLVTCIQ